jgi:hypothetical protein
MPIKNRKTRDDNGVPVIIFFHRQFNEELRGRSELLDDIIEN